MCEQTEVERAQWCTQDFTENPSPWNWRNSEPFTASKKICNSQAWAHSYALPVLNFGSHQRVYVQKLQREGITSRPSIHPHFKTRPPTGLWPYHVRWIGWDQFGVFRNHINFSVKSDWKTASWELHVYYFMAWDECKVRSVCDDSRESPLEIPVHRHVCCWTNSLLRNDAYHKLTKNLVPCRFLELLWAR